MKNLILLAILVASIFACTTSNTGVSKDEHGIRVKTVVVRSINDDKEMGYSGTVEASLLIPLNFKTAGTVDKIFADVGDPVRKGQLLASLDESDAQNLYNAMLAKYQQAEDAYNRLKMVHDAGSLPEIKWAEMKSDLEQAKSSLDLAQNNLDKCKLVSPVDGIVGRRNIEPGQSSISLTSSPFEIVKLETVLVKISVPENEINKITGGQMAHINVSALQDKKYEGTVSNISPVAEIMSRTYTVKITIANTGHDLKPGMVCDVRLDFNSGSNVIIVPNKAVSKDSAGNIYVYVVSPDNKTVKKQLILVGQFHDSGIEVTGGLKEGQVIVCEGGEKLSDNSLITL
jgi:RND family efflux transporter MFP subunit